MTATLLSIVSRPVEELDAGCATDALRRLCTGARGVADGTLTRDEAPDLVFRSLHEGLHV